MRSVSHPARAPAAGVLPGNLAWYAGTCSKLGVSLFVIIFLWKVDHYDMLFVKYFHSPFRNITGPITKYAKNIFSRLNLFSDSSTQDCCFSSFK